jgi:long-chain acyl-CoA synthetase
MSLLWPILTQAAKTPLRTAVIDDQRVYTYAQLAGAAMSLAERIDSLTSAKHIGILLPTSGAFPIALLAAWLAKRVAVPFNYLLAREELTHVIRDSDVDTIITVGPMLDHLASSAASPAHGDQAQSDTPTLPIPPDIQLLRLDQLDWSGLPPLRWPPLYKPDDLAVILYTSGTSGRPKGVMLTHGNLRSNVDAAIQHAHFTPSDTFLGVLPQFHSFGLTGLTLLPLRIGTQVIYTARFVPRRIVELIRKNRPAVIVAIPSMYGALLSVKRAGPEDFASIRLAVSGGEPLPESTADQCRQRFGLCLNEGYGLTETSPFANWCNPETHKPHSVGTSIPGVTVSIVDEHDRPLPPSQDGEILITGPNIMAGYYKLPEQTRQVFVDLPHPHNGTGTSRYFRTGDIGRVDDDGHLYITGRKKEMIIIGGENVSPREIEEVLNQFPTVKDSAVIGKTDPLRGELPIAFVEINDGESFDETALRSWCRDRLAGYKVPREIRLIDALPRNATGKIMRRNLPRDT